MSNTSFNGIVASGSMITILDKTFTNEDLIKISNILADIETNHESKQNLMRFEQPNKRTNNYMYKKLAGDLHGADFSEIVKFLISTDFDIHTFWQNGWLVINYIGKNNNITYELALTLANNFKQRFGDIIIDMESIVCSKQFTTIMDDIEEEVNDKNDPMLRAFRDVGFKYGKDVSPLILDRFCSNNFKSYYESDNRIITSVYTYIKQNPLPYISEIMKYLLQPRFIEKWLIEGNEIEDYLV